MLLLIEGRGFRDGTAGAVGTAKTRPASSRKTASPKEALALALKSGSGMIDGDSMDA